MQLETAMTCCTSASPPARPSSGPSGLAGCAVIARSTCTPNGHQAVGPCCDTALIAPAHSLFSQHTKPATLAAQPTGWGRECTEGRTPRPGKPNMQGASGLLSQPRIERQRKKGACQDFSYVSSVHRQEATSSQPPNIVKDREWAPPGTPRGLR